MTTGFSRSVLDPEGAKRLNHVPVDTLGVAVRAEQTLLLERIAIALEALAPPDGRIRLDKLEERVEEIAERVDDIAETLGKRGTQ